jgi:spermidine synthase
MGSFQQLARRRALGATRRSPGRERQRVVFQTWSALSGPVRVVDEGGLRHLVAGGATLSAISLSGDWSRLGDEYWGRALDLAMLPRRPAALFVGMGGGTQPLLLSARTRPRSVTVVERDPVILRVAQRYFGLSRLRRAEFLCGDIEHVLPWLESARRRFDFVMEDAIYADPGDHALPIVLRLAGLLVARGVLVVNRHGRRDAAETAAALRRHFARVMTRRVRKGAENVLICATGRRRA